MDRLISISLENERVSVHLKWFNLNRDIPLPEGRLIIVYHGFYPIDDVARRRPTIGATNREFHHLAMGILTAETTNPDIDNPIRRSTYMFSCAGPDRVHMMPINHPFLSKLNDHGQPDPNGSHIVLFSIIGSPASWKYRDDRRNQGDCMFLLRLRGTG